jgi:hypothetical protein
MEAPLGAECFVFWIFYDFSKIFNFLFPPSPSGFLRTLYRGSWHLEGLDAAVFFSRMVRLSPVRKSAAVVSSCLTGSPGGEIAGR